MKGVTIMTLLLFVLFNAGMSQTVSLSGRDVPLVEMFAKIKEQTGIGFFYEAALLRDAKPVTIQVKQVPLQTALNELFKDQPVTWVMEGRMITVVKRPSFSTDPHGVPIPVLSKPPIRVRGQITDRDGNPVEGVSVLVKGTNKGAVSDTLGEFFIEADQKNVLRFSSVNYSSKEVKVQKEAMNIRMELDIKPMQSFILGGNQNPIQKKMDATSVSVMESKTIERSPENLLDNIFRGMVPATNSYDIGDEPEGIPTLSIRGANGPNSLSPVAVYIDGVEFAGGSGYLSQLDKTNIDRIEIVRGPGAATMYGTGSNGGIVQIYTKKGRPDQSSVNFTAGAGFYKSKWVNQNPMQQLYNLETSTGFKNVALRFGGTYRNVGAYLPEGGEKNKSIYISARWNYKKWDINISERYNVRNFHLSRRPYYDTCVNPQDDIIIEPMPGFRVPAYIWLNVKPLESRNKDGKTETYITGINVSHNTTTNWVNSLDAGYTMNNRTEVPALDGSTPLQSLYSGEKTNVTTIRYSNVLSIRKNKDLSAVITSGAEYKRYASSGSITMLTFSALRDIPDNKNIGTFVQLNPSYKNVFLTLGLRYEKNDLFKAVWNPRIGLTTNFDAATIIVKPKISWGRGISSPTYEQRFGRPAAMGMILKPNPDIRPQSQQGFDLGVEVYDKQGKSKFEAVYYDNMLMDMIARESLGPDPLDTGKMAFKYTNVGRVSNTGWEFSAEYQLRRFSVKGTFSIMSSIVKDSTGSSFIRQQKLSPGESMYNLPKHTAGVNLTYSFYKLFGKSDKGVVALNVTEIDGVKFLDYRRYALDVAYGRTAYVPGGLGYTVESKPVFMVNIYSEYYITSNLRSFMQGSNILNEYADEYSVEYPTHGATWLFGVKYQFTKKH